MSVLRIAVPAFATLAACENAGVSWRAETPEGDPAAVKRLWEVCDQERAPNRSVVLYVDRDCG